MNSVLTLTREPWVRDPRGLGSRPMDWETNRSDLAQAEQGKKVKGGDDDRHSFRRKIRPEEPTATSDVDSKRKETAL